MIYLINPREKAPAQSSLKDGCTEGDLSCCPEGKEGGGRGERRGGGEEEKEEEGGGRGEMVGKGRGREKERTDVPLWT